MNDKDTGIKPFSTVTAYSLLPVQNGAFVQLEWSAMYEAYLARPADPIEGTVHGVATQKLNAAGWLIVAVSGTITGPEGREA